MDYHSSKSPRAKSPKATSPRAAKSSQKTTQRAAKSPKATSPRAVKSPKAKSPLKTLKARKVVGFADLKGTKFAAGYPEAIALEPSKHAFKLDDSGHDFYLLLSNGQVDWAILYDNEANKAVIYKGAYSHNFTIVTYTQVAVIVNVKKLFVGKSPANELTRQSGSYGSKYDGNSVLLELNSGACICYEHEFRVFTPLAPIKKYVSPVGENDSPYPYALDADGNLYDLTHGTIVINADEKNIIRILNGDYQGAKTKKIKAGVLIAKSKWRLFYV